MGLKLWNDVVLPFVRPGYQVHIENGRVRKGKNNPIKDYTDDRGNVYTNFSTPDGENLPVPKLWLFALMFNKPERPRVDIDDPDAEPDPDVDPDVIARVDRFNDCGVPFEQCPYCDEPIPHQVVALAPVPGYSWFRRDKDAELKHELLCLASLMKERPLGERRKSQKSTPYINHAGRVVNDCPGLQRPRVIH